MENKIEKKLVIYGDKSSQPVRSVLIFCEINKIPYKFVNINLSRGEQFTNEELKKVNPHGKVPAITYTNEKGETFNLAESCTILRFLSEIYNTDKKWYARNCLYRRALIDQYLDWHHLNPRFLFTSAIIKYVMGPKIIKLGGEFEKKVKSTPETLDQIPKILSYFDKILKTRKYIIDNEISIADLIFACEVYQTKILGFDLTQYQNLWTYLQNINNIPEVKAINGDFERMYESMKKRNLIIDPYAKAKF